MEEERLKDRGRLSLLALKHNSLFISGECLVCTVGCQKDRNHDPKIFLLHPETKSRNLTNVQSPNCNKTSPKIHTKLESLVDLCQDNVAKMTELRWHAWNPSQVGTKTYWAPVPSSPATLSESWWESSICARGPQRVVTPSKSFRGESSSTSNIQDFTSRRQPRREGRCF